VSGAVSCDSRLVFLRCSGESLVGVLWFFVLIHLCIAYILPDARFSPDLPCIARNSSNSDEIRISNIAEKPPNRPIERRSTFSILSTLISL